MARRGRSEQARSLAERAESREQQLLEALRSLRQEADISSTQLEDMVQQQVSAVAAAPGTRVESSRRETRQTAPGTKRNSWQVSPVSESAT